MQLPTLDRTHKQRYVRNGIRYRGIFKITQISNHDHAKTQAEIEQIVQAVFNMEKRMWNEMMIMHGIISCIKQDTALQIQTKYKVMKIKGYKN